MWWAQYWLVCNFGKTTPVRTCKRPRQFTLAIKDHYHGIVLLDFDCLGQNLMNVAGSGFNGAGGQIERHAEDQVANVGMRVNHKKRHAASAPPTVMLRATTGRAVQRERVSAGESQ